MLTMTPQARAIAVFTLAVLVLTGHLNRIAFAIYVAAGVELPGGDGARLVLSLMTVATAAAVLWLAHTTAEAGTIGWETSLAQAARVLALIGVAVAVLATISVLTNDGTLFGPLSLGS